LDFFDQRLNDTPFNENALFLKLTHREREILSLIAKGISNAEISDSLFISPKTVRNHITNIFAKLEINNRAKAIVLAREAGLGR
jgi:DNA-binding CsgD family transcriptional regulator